ncbi:efflux RND transporter periplasmic adaptor subunit [Stappia sp. MMSF_3263]|uniref:efflux RND transporter periplasmic adaptor subunit n=1 Tax=Stappia sp. MMSF_3263 TaxID=3046693 RepID=UPI00273EC556|nr:efflux RND transporter periplasmic adaptor subunit [Stappia sp. MMSF_3263]
MTSRSAALAAVCAGGLMLAALSASALAASLVVEPRMVTEWKAVFGQVEARDEVPARARIGGTLAALEVEEGDTVAAGARIATVTDEKIAFRAAAIDARLRALESQLANAEAELARAETLVERGVATRQRVEQLGTAAEVVRNQISAARAERSVVVQQGEEGAVLAPAAGRILKVPATTGTVVLPGETVALLGSGGTFLRLSVPERHAARLTEGARIEIETGEGIATGRLAKVYPTIENGRVVADVEVPGLDARFVNARLLVRLPVGERFALLLPPAAVSTRGGLDFVRVATRGGEVERTVLTGGLLRHDGESQVEILTGLAPGDEVIVP